MNRACLGVIAAFCVTVSAPPSASVDDRPASGGSHILSAGDVERLLLRPACFESLPDPRGWARIESLPIPSNGITLSAGLYLPRGEGPWPAVILVPGGFNETELIMLAPRHYAPRLAACGFAAVVYYKRGTGPSGGVYADATFDDFIDDIGSIAKQLARQPGIDPARIGAQGGSSGGLFASVAAARYPEISFVVNTSGPIVPREEESNFNIEFALRSRGFADSLVDEVMPLWKRHHAAWARADTAALQAVATEIASKRESYVPDLLPTPYNEVFADSNLVFMWPVFRSASRDHLVELTTMRKKWLSIYGEKDPIVPVTSCVRSIHELMEASGNDQYDVIVLPGVDHSFFKRGSGDQVPVIRIVVNWLTAQVGTQQ